MKTEIKLLIVKYKGEVVQIDGLYDIYTEVQIYSLNKDIKEKNGMIYSIGEAKDITGKFGEIEVLIQDFNINL